MARINRNVQEEIKDTPVVSDEFQIEVGDPLVFKPVDLPLVVKPADGQDWQNEAQAEYAKVVNAYAYKNQKKWSKNQIDFTTGREIPNSSKKDILLARLKEIGANPDKLKFYQGDFTLEPNKKLDFKNHLTQQ